MASVGAEPAPALPRVLGALADDTRWAILVRLGSGPASASALARELPVSRQAVAKHLQVLTEVDLVSAERVGRELRYALDLDRIETAGDDLRAIAIGWRRRLEDIRRRAEAMP